MTRLLIRGVLLALVAALAACASWTPPRADSPPALIPVRHLVADWNGSGDYKISPDGQRLMWVARRGLGPGLFVKNLKSGEVHSYGVPGGGVWARDSRHIFLHLQNKGDENTFVWAIDTLKPKEPPRVLTPFAGTRSYILRQLPRSDDLILAHNRRDPRFNDVYRYAMASGELKLLATNPGQVGQWLVNDEGEVAGRLRLEGENWVFETPGSPPEPAWTSQFQVSYFDSFKLIAASATPGHWWALSSRGRDKQVLVEVALRNGVERVVHADDKVDVSGVLLSPRQQAPLAVLTEAERQHWHAFEGAFQQAFKTLKGQTDARIEPHSLSDDERWMTATVNRHNGGEHVLYDLKLNTFQTLSELGRNRVQARSPLSPHQPIVVKSRDGLDLHGYLSLPIGAAKPYPTVVLVHGGPWARDVHLDTDPMLALLTNRGYAVLQLNYRGSSGYGKAFMNAAQGEFAGKMHSDLIDAVDALAGQGVIDSQRVAISGSSYGGYASLVGMTHTPGKFRCGISTVGMSDLAALIDNAPPYWALSKPHWIRYVGDPADPVQRAAMQERSPLYKADQVQGPILLMHGVHDARVKVSQSVHMAEALRAQGKSVELVLFDKAGHGFRRWQDSLLAFRKTEDFLASCLGGRSRGFDFFELGARLF